MYESFFALSQRPFAPAPHADAYIPTASLEHARQTLVRCLERASGPGLLIGPAGTGKTILLNVLAKHFRGHVHVASLSAARLCTRKALLQSMLFELRLPYRGMDEGELRLSLIDHLEPRPGAPAGLLLLVDEAQSLPLRLLEEIRLLTNVVREGQSRVRLVLAGNMALEERLASPNLESFQQRIAARCYLQAFSRDETIYYVREQIRRAGGAPANLVADEALAAIHTAADGIPRLINQLCDHALMIAALAGLPRVDAAGIEEAWADLQQLPVPLHETRAAAIPESGTSSRGGGGGAAVEFGQLSDDAAVAGSIRPSTADVAQSRLDMVSHGIMALETDQLVGASGDSPSDDFIPAPTAATEVELIFHGAHDPFGGSWEEEEIVIDRYASLEDAAVSNRQRATSDHGREFSVAIAAAMSTADHQAMAQTGPQISPLAYPTEEETGDETPLSIAATMEFRPASFQPESDPLLPEDSPPVAPRSTIPLNAPGHDDRDLIVVDEDEPRQPAAAQLTPRRPEYRKLFSTLRNR